MIVALIGAYFAAVLALLIVVLWMSLLPSSERPRLGWIAGLLVGGVGVSWVVLAMK